MNWTDKLRAWGSTYAAAKAAERAAAHTPSDSRLGERARELRDHADRLHREICREPKASRQR